MAASLPPALTDGASQTAVQEGRAVRARNFPATWLTPAAIGGLPAKAQTLLARIGEIVQAPIATQGLHGHEVIAFFKTAASAKEAVRRLHNLDLRSEAGKKAAGSRPAEQHERFWLQLVEPGSAPLAASGEPSRQATAKSSSSQPKKRVIPNGLVLSPLPPTWTEQDISVLLQPYGRVLRLRFEQSPSGDRAAYIDFQSESLAKAAQQGLNGLSLYRTPLQCVFQEEMEPQKPPQKHIIFIDELPMQSRPDVEPRMDDRELFLLDLPSTSKEAESAAKWLSGLHGGVEEVLLLRDEDKVATGKAYAKFRSHRDCLATLKQLQALSGDDVSLQKVCWSESERVLQGRQSPYGIDVLKLIAGSDGANLASIAESAGAASLELATPGATARTSGSNGAAGVARVGAAGRVHFIAGCEEPGQAVECRRLLAIELSKAHEAYKREVYNTLVVRGFPPSWSEKGFKFIFASYGGVANVAINRDAQAKSADSNAKSSGGGLAYVRLRNASAMDKAASNLNGTKVGDGDLVEECVVSCTRRRLHTWSDGDFLVRIFIDQLQLSQKRTAVGPGSEDRELFVKNLPLQDMNRQQLQEYFEGFGEVENLHLIPDAFTKEDTSEGYVRFKSHSDAVRCIEALSPGQEADAEATDLTGQWSESERALQLKSSCYGLNLILDLVGKDGSGLKQIKSESKVKRLWVLAESLTQRDKHAPQICGKQLQFVARCSDESQVELLRQSLERTVEAIHKRVAKRLDRKRRRTADAAAGVKKQKPAAESAPPAKDAPAPPAAGAPSPAPTAWTPPAHGAAPPGAPPGAAAPQWAPPPGYYWPPPGAPAPAAACGKGGEAGWPDPYRGYPPPAVMPPHGWPSWGPPGAHPPGPPPPGPRPVTGPAFEAPVAGQHPQRRKAEDGGEERQKSRRRHRRRRRRDKSESSDSSRDEKKPGS